MGILEELYFWFILFSITIDIFIILYIIQKISRYRNSKKKQSCIILPQICSVKIKSAIPFIDEYNMIPTSSWIRVRNIYMH
ncbi:MAG: hypothetical protein ACFFEY_06805 [Candidatus Thorarchaeota archaeon]